ncbi:synaptobrevin [Stagonosporopsis vannaccii]|nr:synaptobrevin [Stagonosporopsis vannaccii]
MTRIARRCIPSFLPPTPTYTNSPRRLNISYPTSSHKITVMASSSSSTPLLYACIAHNTTVLSEHTASASSNASSLVSLVLPKLTHTSSAHKTIDQSKFFIHVVTKSPSDFPSSSRSAGGLTFLVIAERDLGQRIPFGFLTNLEKKFFDAFDASETNFADLPPYGCASFNTTLKKLMIEQGATQAGQADALRTAQREIEGVREIMTENIERVLERGEHMSVLVDKTEEDVVEECQVDGVVVFGCNLSDLLICWIWVRFAW